MTRETLKDTREDIKQFASDAFMDHQVTPVDGYAFLYRCAKPGTGVYAFYVACLPGAVVVYGDIGEIVLRPHDDRDVLPWLRGAVRSPSYLIEKARPQPVEDFYRADAHEWLTERAKDLAESDKAFDEEADLRAILDDESCSPEEFARELSNADLLDRDIPGMGPSATTLWIVEALRWFVAHVYGPEERT